MSNLTEISDKLIINLTDDMIKDLKKNISDKIDSFEDNLQDEFRTNLVEYVVMMLRNKKERREITEQLGSVYLDDKAKLLVDWIWEDFNYLFLEEISVNEKNENLEKRIREERGDVKEGREILSIITPIKQKKKVENETNGGLTGKRMSRDAIEMESRNKKFSFNMINYLENVNEEEKKGIDSNTVSKSRRIRGSLSDMNYNGLDGSMKKKENIKIRIRVNNKNSQRYISMNEGDNRKSYDEKIGLEDRKLIGKKRKVVAIKNNHNDDDDDNQSPSKRQKIKNDEEEVQRCVFWPNCNRSNCKFYHPKDSEICKFFPNCKNGDDCKYVHPEPIAQSHSKNKKKKSSYQAAFNNQYQPQYFQVPACKFGFSCKNRTATCTFEHPREICRFGKERCVRGKLCKYSHAVPCKFGFNCNKVGCTYGHLVQSTELSLHNIPDEFEEYINKRNEKPDEDNIDDLSDSLPLTPPRNDD